MNYQKELFITYAHLDDRPFDAATGGMGQPVPCGSCKWLRPKGLQIEGL